MYSNSILTRVEDGKVFKVTFHSHWSEIKAEDGETDYVKWGFDDLYVSADKGFTYKVTGSAS